jgi:hypothetical protein
MLRHFALMSQYGHPRVYDQVKIKIRFAFFHYSFQYLTLSLHEQNLLRKAKSFSELKFTSTFTCLLKEWDSLFYIKSRFIFHLKHFPILTVRQSLL